jgi:hypothetical protein
MRGRPSLLTLDRLAADGMEAELTRQLREAAYRVSAVARAHERIHPRNEPDQVDLGLNIEEVCLDLNQIGHCTIHADAPDPQAERQGARALMTNSHLTDFVRRTIIR